MGEWPATRSPGRPGPRGTRSCRQPLPSLPLPPWSPVTSGGTALGVSSLSVYIFSWRRFTGWGGKGGLQHIRFLSLQNFQIHCAS